MLLWEVFNLDSWLHFALDKSFLLNPLNKLKRMTLKMIGALQFRTIETYTQPCPDGGYGEKHYGTLTLQRSKRWRHIDVDPPRTKHSRLFFSSLSALSLSLELRPLPPRKRLLSWRTSPISLWSFHDLPWAANALPLHPVPQINGNVSSLVKPPEALFCQFLSIVLSEFPWRRSNAKKRDWTLSHTWQVEP